MTPTTTTAQVRIKTWDEMEKEYGLDSDGDINCDASFVTGMEIEMPKDRIITVEPTNDGSMISRWRSSITWSISDEMIAEYLTNDKPILSRPTSEERILKLRAALQAILDSPYIGTDGDIGRNIAEALKEDTSNG